MYYILEARFKEQYSVFYLMLSCLYFNIEINVFFKQTELTIHAHI